MVAADSRSNLNLGETTTSHCDTATKIIPLKNHERAVIAVAGTDKSYALKADKVSDDPCAYLQSDMPILDMSQIVSDYLDAKSAEITKQVLAALETHVLQNIRAVQAKRPNSLVNSEDGIFAVVAFGHFIPDQKVSIVAMFKVRILKHGSPIIIERDWNAYHISSNWEVKAIGDGAKLLQQLLNEESPGFARYLREYAHYMHESSPVGAVPGDAGAKVAMNMMEAAKILSDQLPQAHTVGGPTHVFILSAEQPAPLPIQ